MKANEDSDSLISVLCISLMIYNFLIFLFFAYNYFKKKTQKMILQITMILQIIRNFRFYIFYIDYNHYSTQFIDFILKVLSFMFCNLLNDTINQKITQAIYLNVNNLIQFQYIATILLELFYSWEYLHLALHPLDESKKRKFLYSLSTMVILVISYITKADDKQIQLKQSFTILSICDYVLKAVYLFLGIVALILLLRQTSITIVDVRRSKILIALRHFLYILAFSTLNGIVFLFRVEYIERNTFLIMTMVLEAFIDFIKINELNLINCRRDKKEETEIRSINNISQPLVPRSTESETYLTGNNSNLDLSDEEMLIRNSRFFTEITKEQKKTSSELVNNAIMSESIYLILEGILHISKAKDITNSYYSMQKKKSVDKIIHEYVIQNNELKRINSSTLSDNKKRYNSWCSIFQNKVSLIEYYPSIFSKIWIMEGLTSEKMLNSFNIEKNKKNLLKLCKSEGRSGSLFFFTHDNKYIIKTIPERELKSMKKLIKPYFTHLSENKHTFLVRIYGVFTLNIGISEIHLILMENVAPYDNSKILYRFDLKGSFVHRKTKDLIKNIRIKALKDLDFLELKQKVNFPLIALSKSNINFSLQVIKRDLKVLAKCNLMDYSLFIAIVRDDNNRSEETEEDDEQQPLKGVFTQNKNTKYTYCISIIDFLTEYTFRKKMENFYKTFTKFGKAKNAVSVVDATTYSVRFTNFMREHVFTVDSTKKNN